LKSKNKKVRIYTNVNCSYFIIESKEDFNLNEILKCKELKFLKDKYVYFMSEGKNVDA
jgi:hypothetical protein